jgi:hypothetical protein
LIFKLNLKVTQEVVFLVNLNFFCNHHGKNNRDAHFSNILRFIQAESLVNQLNSSQDIVDAIHKRQGIANENQKS